MITLDPSAFPSVFDDHFGFISQDSAAAPVAEKKPSSPVMVRMDISLVADLRQIAKANGLSMSDIVRLAISRELPSLRAGNTTLTKPAKSAN